MIFKSRKGQGSSASGAATLVTLIGVIFILYILFLPPNVRESMLNPDNETNPYSTTDSSGKIKSVLLDRAPGRIDYITTKEFEHSIPSFNLRKTTNSKIFVQENPFFIKRSWFSSKEKNVDFDIVSLKDTKDLKLSFNAPGREGRLEIYLNGYEIFNQELTNTLIEPINLKEEYLMQKNKLIFKVSSPNWKFWSSNSYSIDNLIVAGDVSDSSNLEGRHTFFIEDEEKRNINEARLIFIPVCEEAKVGKLEIDINGENVYSSIPDCGTYVRVDISPNILMAEDNYVYFKTAFGQYLLDAITVKTEISESYYPTYYFELSQSQYDNIQDKDDLINMTFNMLDNDEFKEAYVYINSRRAYIDTKDPLYTKDLRNFVEEGTNTLQIKPMKTMEIVRLRVAIHD
jgi:hypothetical protein